MFQALVLLSHICAGISAMMLYSVHPVHAVDPRVCLEARLLLAHCDTAHDTIKIVQCGTLKFST